MKTYHLLVAILILLLSSYSFANIDPIDDIYKDNSVEFDQEIFKQYMAESFKDAKGYAYIVSRNGKYWFGDKKGYAVNDDVSEDKLAFNYHTMANIGSISKVYTSLLLMRMWEEEHNFELADQIDQYLPSVWMSYTHPSIKTLSVRNFLNHTSGFHEIDGDDVKVKDYYVQGVKVEDIGSRNYSNVNFHVLGMAYAYIKYHDQMVAKEEQFTQDYPNNESKRDELLEEAAAEYFISDLTRIIHHPIYFNPKFLQNQAFTNS